MYERNPKFHREVMACAADLNSQLPQLLARYKPVVVAAALATHVSGALRVLIQVGSCTPESAREIFRIAERVAFTGEEQGPPRRRPS